MQLLHTIKELRTWRKDKGFIGFVPTMGNLHDGHLQLVKEAKKLTDYVVVSIFVNPIQFGEGEDFDSYPRTLDQDMEKLVEAGVSVVFAPEVKELYPIPQTVFIEPSTIQNELCGITRPGHFRGAATVVNKLFNIVQPNIACFGKKDYQQLFIIKEMVANLNMPVQIIGVNTGRAKDGLALSSRNGYLTDAERLQAPTLYQTLTGLQQAIKAGSNHYQNLLADAKQKLNDSGWQVEYIELRNANTLQAAKPEDKNLVILAAARLGKTRLIDNIEITL
ncbi:pantoate--beta-alanine ligase [Entomomonas asaccharolytica]|uniref:Pantothenate synthetase n=1 Tax=Entomomonas asaccharolytica TaxID=2785331 RepID=A0A974RX82_9GAMM|nr:pantoate--beta-alanine ligase [Entomomonas asaccharolytica]QQP85986.1 pantoate--beta-alanine ligase [Entomomonas asaccharolytica]